MTDGKMLPQASATILEEQVGLSLGEISRACAVRAELIVELVNVAFGAGIDLAQPPQPSVRVIKV